MRCWTSLFCARSSGACHPIVETGASLASPRPRFLSFVHFVRNSIQAFAIRCVNAFVTIIYQSLRTSASWFADLGKLARFRCMDVVTGLSTIFSTIFHDFVRRATWFTICFGTLFHTTILACATEKKKTYIDNLSQGTLTIDL